MFERYTEKARRVIFFARYEASHFGSPYIETEHLLIGLLREDKALANRLLGASASTESIRGKIEERTTVRENILTSVDLPLSNECKRVLAYAAEESEATGHSRIGTEHVLLGLMREERSFAAELLREQHVTLSTAREDLLKHGLSTGSPDPSSVRQPLRFGASVPTLRVADLSASETFYAKLGFRTLCGQGKDPVRLLSGNAALLVLYNDSLSDKLLCFPTADLAPVLKHVANGALKLEDPLSVFEGSSFNLLLRDPDGNLILLLAPDARTV